MRNIPVDQSALGDLMVVGVRPKMVRPDGQAEAHQKGNADGIPQWTVETLRRGRDEEASELLNVTVAASEKPGVEGPAQFESLTAIPWEFSGRSGVALTASAVVSVRAGSARSQPKEGGEA